MIRDLTHIERPRLPWHSERQTECALDATRHPTWARDEAFSKAKEMGDQRFSLHVCMTCWRTAARHATWEENPASCLQRYVNRLPYYWRDKSESGEARQFNDELRAIAALIDNHRDEFDALCRGLAAAVRLPVRARKIGEFDA